MTTLCLMMILNSWETTKTLSAGKLKARIATSTRNQRMDRLARNEQQRFTDSIDLTIEGRDQSVVLAQRTAAPRPTVPQATVTAHSRRPPKIKQQSRPRTARKPAQPYANGPQRSLTFAP
jgi:hypothetical protein